MIVRVRSGLVTSVAARPVELGRHAIVAFRARQRALPAPLRLQWLAGVAALFFVCIAAWVVATPIWASPDENQHAIRAYGVAHGQIVVPDRIDAHGKVTTGFTLVPRGWRPSITKIRCYAFRPNVTADCIPGFTNDRTPVPLTSSAAHYNPVYYGIVGAPTRYVSPSRSLRAMRFVSAAISAVMLAWALTACALSRYPKLAGAVVVLAGTPMAFFLAASVNPSGLEITAALACWVSAYQVFYASPGPIRTVLLRRASVAACAMVLTRILSPLWLVVLAATLLVLVPWGQIRAAIDREFLKWTGLVAFCGFLAVAWSYLDGTVNTDTLSRPSHLDLVERVLLAWGFWPRERHMWFGQVGNFGWLDTELPTWSIYPCIAAVLGVVVTALVFGRNRARIALTLLAITCTALPVLLNALTWNTTGSVWQPRYTMPLSLGLLVVAGLVVANNLPDRRRRMVMPLTIAILAICLWTQVSAISVAMSRYIVGLNHPITLSGGRWQPAYGGWTWFVVETVGVLGLSAVVLFGFRQASLPDDTPINDRTVQPEFV